jgi:ureidoglycolate lyase
MPDEPTLTVTPEPLTEDRWAPFGWLPVPDTDATDGEHTLDFAWGDAHLNTIEHRTDEVESTASGLRCAVMFRHETHTQALTPLDAHAVLAVAPASADLTTRAGLDAIHAFVLAPGETIVLHRGTWHWGPFPMGGVASVRLLNVQGMRYRDDNASADLGAFVVEIDTADDASRPAS